MSIFKAYDIRGVYPSELNEPMAYNIGKAIVAFFNLKEIVVGRDIRYGNETLFLEFCKGITDQGCDVIDIGLSSTPLLYFTVPFYKKQFGAILTASHNPKEFTGFKLITQDASPIGFRDGLGEIEQMIQTNTIPNLGKNKGKIIGFDQKKLKNDYIKHITSFVNKKALKKIKFVVDCSNGMSSMFVKETIEKIGLKPIILSDNMDGGFPDHGPNPLIEDSLKKLSKEVKKQKARFGACFDGDADRIIFVDEKGKRVKPDYMLILLANALVKKKSEIVLYDLTNSRIVKEELAKISHPIMTKVGQEFIKSKMRDEQALLAGETSGHYTFSKNFFSDSGIITLMIVLNYVCKTSKKFSDIIKNLDKYYKPGNINLKVKNKENIIKNIANNFSDAKSILYLDGVKIEYNDYWFNIRQSNTQDLVRITIEAKTKKLAEEKVKLIQKIVKKLDK